MHESSFRLVGDGSALEEGVASFLCGMLFGATTVAVGHPLDTVKTRMQADPSFKTFNTWQSIKVIHRDAGIVGFYRGVLPPLIGSTFFRSIQFAAYGATFAFFRDEQSVLRRTRIGGIEGRVFVGGMVAGACRTLLEAPLDLIKTRHQTCARVSMRDIPMRDLARGFSATLTRNVFLLMTFFVFVEKLTAVNSFVRGGLATTAAWTLVWPLDVTKSRMQAAEAATVRRSMREVLHASIRDGTMYRGYVAGISRSFTANGASLMAYQWGQRMRDEYFAKA